MTAPTGFGDPQRVTTGSNPAPALTREDLIGLVDEGTIDTVVVADSQSAPGERPSLAAGRSLGP